LIKDPDVAGIIGPFDTATALTELPIANKSGIAMVSPSAGNPCLTSDNPTQQCGGVNSILTMVRPTGNVTFFRTVPTDPKQGTVLSDYLYLTKGYRTAYVIDDTGSYGVSEADAFLSEWQINGGVVLGRSSVPEGTASEVNLLTKIAALRPDVIFFGGSDPAPGTPESSTIRRQMEQIAGLATTPFAGTDGIRTSLFAQSIGLVGGPVWSTLTPADPGSVPAGNTFLPQYQAVYGTPGRYSASGYDSAEVLISAIAAAISNGTQPPAGAGAPAEFRKAVLAAVTQTKLQGVINPISFSADGDLTQGSISIGRLAAVNGAVDWQQVTAQSVR
jgi:branched-chain amino acid transport system substrate-binding protein